MQICNRLYLSKYILYLPILFLLTLPLNGYSQSKTASKKVNSQSLINDTISQKKDTISLQTKKKPGQIDAKIVYSAKDSIVLLGNGTAFLHGKSDITYKSINLKADFVRIKMDSSLIFAKGKTDSIGKKIDEPVFTEDKTEYNTRELNYNLRTKKAYIRQGVTKQGEGFVISDKTKKIGDDILYITNGKYTTCENTDHPDFYLDLTLGKVKTGSYIVTGPAYLVVEDVPLPIALPFGFFPFTDKYSSGVIMPTFRDEMTRGFGLTNGGYYFALSDYADLELRGEIYTKGTWSLSANSKYLKRYKYSGSLSINYREDVTGEKDMPDFNKSHNMSIRWSHSQDQKANPYFNFSTSIDYSTSGYNRSNINSYYNPNLNSENTKSSSISFTKRFPDSPFNISGNMLINQQTRDSMVSITLPNINISMSRIYPFKRKEAVGNDRWYEKISMSYTGTFANSINAKEYKILSSSFAKDWKNGMKHSIPISATFDLFKYINISPSVNYQERWYLQSEDKTWDKKAQKVVSTTKTGFNRVYDFNVGVSASTKLYGFFMPIRSIFGDKIDRIRHVLTPSVGFSYQPDFGDAMWGYYGTYIQTSENPLIQDKIVKYSHYENSLYGTPSIGKSGSINFSLGNNVEMKVRNDKDTTATQAFKIISLIDNFTVSGSYNMAADSMKWSIFSTNLRIKLTKSYTLSLSAGFDPYMNAFSSDGKSLVKINQLRWAHGGFPRFLGTGTTLSYTINNDTFKKKQTTSKNNTDKKNQTKDNTDSNNQLTKNDSNKDQKAIVNDKDGYAKVSIPWSISVNYSVNYGSLNVPEKLKPEYVMGLTHNLNFSGNISLTNNWKFTANTSYDFTANKFSNINININRGLHCWSMSGGLACYNGTWNYNVRIGVNASMLQDLKYEKQSGYGTSEKITWY